MTERTGEDLPWYRTTGPADVLLVAPPGCGKTQQLAWYAAELVQQRLITAPRQVLAMTFSTKATANLRSRIMAELPRHDRRRVAVTNFHGMSYRLFKCHAATLGLDPSTLLPQPGWLATHRSFIATEFNVSRAALERAIHVAKAGGYNQEEVLSRLNDSGGPAAVAYEERLRSAGRLDFDDALRHALRLLRVDSVGHLYRCRFAVVLVDECQDLTPVQYQLVEALGPGRTVFAGDAAQGIFGFAGAEPTWVYEQIAARRPKEVRLNRSYRSSPAVLKVVSAVGAALGGDELECAEPDRWPGGGSVRIERFADAWAEARWVLEEAQRYAAADPYCSIGIMTRTAFRRRDMDATISASGEPFEMWDFPVHRPRVVQLLRRHLPTAIARAERDHDRLDELYLLCFEECSDKDIEVLDELTGAFERLEELILERSLEEIVAGIRTAADDAVPVSPGLHLLTGHVGKGQQFDHLFVVGLEEGILPDYRATTPPQRQEELAVLHVMVSRARQSLVITYSRDVRANPAREWRREPSRWLALLEAAAAS